MSLIARALEEVGIATTSISTSRDITVAARPARSVFVDFPHGHTTGRVGDLSTGETIVRAALDLLTSTTADLVVDLDLQWAADDSWKIGVYESVPTADGGSTMTDSRVERYDAPQFQAASDVEAAAESHAGQDCLVCIGIDI